MTLPICSQSGHNLILFAKEKYYRCPWCGCNEFGPADKIGADQAPYLQYGDTPTYETLPNGKIKIAHGFPADAIEIVTQGAK